jgi:hypothetical protein
MKSRVVQFLLLTGIVSCAKNFDSFEGQSAQPVEPVSFEISSDTIVENASSSGARTTATKTYWLTSTSSVTEGSSVTIKMNTTNVSQGTVIPYTISGISSSDISPTNLSGNFTIGSGGTATVTYKLNADNVAEGTETMKITSNTATLSIAVNDNVAQQLVAGATFLLDTILYGDMDIMAPGRGANTFSTYTQSVKIPDAGVVNWALDNDVRFTWIQMQPTSSSSYYDWSVFDTNINYSISKGQRFSFRVMTLDTDAMMNYSAQSYGGNKLTYPIFVHNSMQGESTKDWTYGGSWIPNWNSPAYLSAWENFLKALANHINSGSYNGVSYKNAIYHIDISGFGNYAEFHSYPFINSYPSSAQKINDASFKRIVDAHTSAFPNFPLIANINMLVGEMSTYAGWYALTASNSWGKFGFRTDHLGNMLNYYYDTRDNTRSYNGLSFKSEIMNRWQYAPMVGEPLNSASTVSSGGSCAYWDMENEVRGLHLSQFSNTSVTAGTSCADNNFRNASKASGYRLSVKSGSVSGTNVTLNWSNSGIAPVYENWDVYLVVKNGSTVVWTGMSSFKPKGFLPGTRSVSTTLSGVSSGTTYSLYVIVKDPTGYRKPLTLSNKNKQSDGSYKVADIKI